MERELKGNEKALDDVADNFDDAEKQADQFGDELDKTGREADSSGGKFEKLGSVVKGIGGNMGKGVGVGFLNAMTNVEREMKRAIPTDFDISATLSGLQPAFAGVSQTVTYNHTGTIRVEGVNDKGMLTGVVDILLGQLRQEARL